MPLHESEAIVLRSYPLAEADRLVSFLSRSMGRMRGVAGGAKKTKSRFGSALERLSYVRIWFHEKETRDLVRISQCEIIESFLDVFRDYALSIALSLFSEITDAVLPEREAADANFRLLLLSVQAVKRTGKSEIPLAYFTVWTVKLGGWLPSLASCGRCGRAFKDKEPQYFSANALAMLCDKCRQGAGRLISQPAVAAAKKMLTEHLDRIVETDIEPRAAREVSEVMLDIIENQIDRKLKSREMLEQTPWP